MQADYTSLLLMLLLIAVGFGARKAGLLQAAHVDAIPALLFNIAYPALIIRSVTSVDVRSLAFESVAVIVVTVVLTLALFALGTRVLRRYKNPSRRPLLLFNMAVGNITYVALPVIRAVFGDEGVYYAVLHGAAQDIFIWTMYYACFAGGGSLKGLTLRKLASPSLVALLVAAPLACVGLRPAGVLDSAVQAVAGLSIPLALIFVGCVLAGFTQWSDWKPDRDTVVISLFKVVALPLIVFGVMQFVPVSGGVRLLMALMFSAPTAVLTTVWAQHYGYDARFAVRTLTFSTALFFLASGLLFMLINQDAIQIYGG